MRQHIKNSSIGGLLRVVVCLAVLGPGTVSSSPASPAAENGTFTEADVKAAYLFNFTKFIAWPKTSFEDLASPFVIGVVGEKGFLSNLQEHLKGQNVEGRSVSVRPVQSDAELRACHIVFVAASSKRQAPRILEAVRTASVLTVGEADWFTPAGGMVSFVVKDNRVRFEINPDAASRAGLRISYKLLSLAKIVKDSTPESGH